jgi:hypothetical protein
LTLTRSSIAGLSALQANTTGADNTANGEAALSGVNNMADGYLATSSARFKEAL